MKTVKLCLCICLCLLSFQPLQATTKKTIVIASKQLPYIMYVEVLNEKNMKVSFISRSLQIPMTCSSLPMVPIKRVDLKEDFSCVKKSLEEFYHISSKNYVYIHLNRIAKDLQLPYDKIDFNKIGNITDYFAALVKKLTISSILSYNRYIESDLNLKDYYDYYQMFKNKHVNITYSFNNQVYVGSYALPLDRTLHKER